MQAADAADAAGAAVVAAMFGSGTGGKGLTTTEVTEVTEGAEVNGGVSSTPLKKKGRAALQDRPVFFARSPLNFGTTRLLKKYGQPVGLMAALEQSVDKPVKRRAKKK